MKVKHDYAVFPIITLELKNYEDELEELEVIIDTGYEDQLIVNTITFIRLGLNRWISPRGAAIMRLDPTPLDPTIIYGRGKINIPGLFNGHWEVDVATYPKDPELRNTNLLGLGILDNMYSAFNALSKPKKLTLCRDVE
jgi:hypothetical protein